MISAMRVTTGLKGLDDILNGLRIGDNVVWRVDNISDYQYFVTPFVRDSLKHGKRVVYIRFAQHKPLIEATDDVVVYELDAFRGFESFTTRIHSIVADEGKGVFYVFDCLSDLLSAWATDQMIGSFFMVTCPYLFQLDTVGYFALMRASHSFKTIARIRQTTQVLLDIHDCGGKIHIHPLKVWNRHSPTMFLPHIKKDGSFAPVANSCDATNLLTSICRRTWDDPRLQLDYWDRLFLEAEDLAMTSSAEEDRQQMTDQLCRVMISRRDRMLSLSRTSFPLRDLLDIKSRMVGTGFIGGKAAGMLLARKILLRDQSFDWKRHLEPHDSFYIGSDVYYSYIVHNGWWELLMRQKTKEGYFEVAKELREKMRHGTFPDDIREEFQKMLEYFGQYPIIVRSSSLLEDDFGNAFAGKYKSFFCVNQGTPEQRYKQLEEAIRNIFASTMSEDALAYRRQRGLDQMEEQMALLIQRVSGAFHKHYYFPELAGVGFSYNTFVWNRDLDPNAGMLRLVFGLGTRAVDRVDVDYLRIVALDAPLMQPQQGIEDTRRFSQKDVDLLNVNDNVLQTISLLTLSNEKVNISLDLYAIRDYETARKLAERGSKGHEAWLLTFDRLLSETSFTNLMQRMLKTLENAYQYPVDVEFTVNLASDGAPCINLLQCRPLQTKGQQIRVEMPDHVDQTKLFFQSEGNFMGGSISQTIKRVIWVDPEQYVRLLQSEKYDIARLVGRLNRTISDKREPSTMLMGPGRWGTSTPSLGVPVRFAEINNFTALAEVAFRHAGLMPELSFGTHFFLDLVETDIFYLALYPEHDNCFLNKDWMSRLSNAVEDLIPSAKKYKHVVKVCDVPGKGLQLMADVVSQKMICLQSVS